MDEKRVYELEIQESITGKQRPRMNTYTGRAYTPTKTKNYEYLVRQLFVYKYPQFVPIEGRVRMTITAYYELPNKRSKLQEAEMLQGNISPTKKPDADNIIKIVLDAMNKFAFNDDTQVTKLEIEKKYDKIPRIYIKVEEY